MKRKKVIQCAILIVCTVCFVVTGGSDLRALKNTTNRELAKLSKNTDAYTIKAEKFDEILKKFPAGIVATLNGISPIILKEEEILPEPETQTEELLQNTEEIPAVELIQEFDITESDFLTAFAEVKHGETLFYDYGKYHAYQIRLENLRILWFQLPESDKISAIMLSSINELNSNLMDDMKDAMDRLHPLLGLEKGGESVLSDFGYDTLEKNVPLTKTGTKMNVTVRRKENGIPLLKKSYPGADVLYMPNGSLLEEESFPLEIERQKSFLSEQERREKIQSLAGTFSFSEIFSLAEEYIAQENPKENDVSYYVQEKALQALELMEKCTETVDTFNGKKYVYAKGVEQVSAETAVIPFLESTSNSSHLIRYAAKAQVGLGKLDSGLLLNSFGISVNGAVVTQKNVDQAELRYDTLNGNNRVTCGLDSEIYLSSLAKKMQQNPDADVIVRFYLHTGVTSDVILSEAEVSAIYLIEELEKVRQEIVILNEKWKEGWF